MKRNKMTFEPKLSLAKKISIKALDFGKLPKKLMGSNFKMRLEGGKRAHF